MSNLPLIILAIGVAFMLNRPSIDKDKLKSTLKSIDKELSNEFRKRDERIEKLELEIMELKQKGESK